MQFLRALAALAVVYFHAVAEGGIFALPGTGPWGVDVFFVISGFIIGTVVFGSRKQFLRRRVIRVVPLYWIATLTWAAAVLLMPWRANSTVVDAGGLIKSLLFIPYAMPERMGPILQIGWTLNYEMFFYLLVGTLLLCVRSTRTALILVGVALVLLVFSGVIWPGSSPALRFYQDPILLEFLAGLGVALVYRRVLARATSALPVKTLGASHGATAWAWLGIAGLGAVFALGVLIAQDLGIISLVSDVRALYYGIPAVLLLVCALVLEPLIRDGLVTRVLLEIGDASYAMYLFHPIVTVFISQVLLGDVIRGAATSMRVMLLIATMIAVTFVSIFINRIIDAPIQRLLRQRLTRTKGLATQSMRVATR
ncbi:acyltransferase family protein [Leucobacter sp. HY1910]